MKSWKLLAITSICIIILVLSLVFLFSPLTERIPLSDHEKEMAIIVATGALKKDLPRNYTVGGPIASLRITPRGSTGEEEKKIAYITFQAENFSAGVVVDTDTWSAVRFTESFDWMTGVSWSRDWYHEGWTRGLNRTYKISMIGILLGGASLLYWAVRRKER